MAGAEEAGGPLRNHWTKLSHTEAPQMMGESWGGATRGHPPVHRVQPRTGPEKPFSRLGLDRPAHPYPRVAAEKGAQAH